MGTERILKGLSWLFLAAGAALLISGAREYLTPIFEQKKVAEQWKPATKQRAVPATISPGDPVGRLSIPRLDASWFIVEGTDHKDLRIGPGHMLGTPLPGANGNCVIAAHRDTHFRALKDIRNGDEILVQTEWGKFTYRVVKTAVVSPKTTKPLQPTSNAVMHLITCYPFYYIGPAPKRFVVQAELVGTPLRETAGEPQNPGEASVVVN